MENKEAKFDSKAQSRLCFALKNRGENKGWNCKEWASKTDYSKLPEKKKDKKVKDDKKEKNAAFYAKVAAFATGMLFKKEAEGLQDIMSAMGAPTSQGGISPLAEKMKQNDQGPLPGRIDMKPDMSAGADVKKMMADINVDLARVTKNLVAAQKAIGESYLATEGTPATPNHQVDVSRI